LNGASVRYWLLLLTKPGQCIEFDAAQLGVTVKTLFNYIEIENGRSGGRYKACSTGGTGVGVRRVHAGGDRG
jgi:hypothetical protein